MKIAWIGTGNMGVPIAERLLNAKYTTIVYNRTQSKTKQLTDNGAIFKSTPKDAVKEADIIFCAVTDDIASKQVWEGEEGIVSGLKPGAVVIECGTLSIARCRSIRDLIRTQAKAMFLSMPLVGTPKEAASGELLLLVGGDTEILEKVRPVLSVIGKDIIPVGDEIHAMALKLALTGSVALQILLQEELLSFLRGYGIKTEMINLFENLPFTSAISEITNKMKVGNAFDTIYPIKLVHKDMRYLADSIISDRKNSLLATVKDIYKDVNTTGKGFQH